MIAFLLKNTDPPLIFGHALFQSLAGLSVLPDQQRSRPEESNGTGTVHLDHRGACKVGFESWLGSGRICRLQPGRSSRDSAAGSKFDPPIDRGSQLWEQLRRGTTFPGRLPGANFKHTLIILSGFWPKNPMRIVFHPLRQPPSNADFLSWQQEHGRYHLLGPILISGMH